MDPAHVGHYLPAKLKHRQLSHALHAASLARPYLACYVKGSVEVVGCPLDNRITSTFGLVFGYLWWRNVDRVIY
jgi:hypothetical protein